MGASAGASKSNGKIRIDIEDDKHDHMVDPADLVRVATSRQ
jgi:hypothetical protein